MNELLGGVALIFFGVYLTCLVVITLFCLIQFHLYYLYRNNLKKTAQYSGDPIKKWPSVTVQLPIFNEKYVVGRLIDKIAELDYPKNKLLIQILDDSTDETSNIIKSKADYYTKAGFSVRHIRRPDREGYKAGALAYGISKASSDFLAIFDADFLPGPDFLKSALSVLVKNDHLALVQTRWRHINQNDSLLTRLQALQLNIHFTIEQKGRMNADLFLQFNGTAGIWRKEAIIDAGGWQHDTLTEDLDLSYRAQLKGWKIAYIEEYSSPAELPVEINSFKSQQFRWMKGGAETAKKLLPSIWASHLPFVKKIHASIHLLGSSTFLFIFLASIVSVPSMALNTYFNVNRGYLMVFLIGTLAFALIFTYANYRAYLLDLHPPSVKKHFSFFIYFPVFLAVFMGMSFHNTIAVFQGFKGIKSSFIRTPKFNTMPGNGNTERDWKSNQYIDLQIGKTTLTEGFLSLYFSAAVIWGLWTEHFFFILYHLSLAVGFGLIFFLSVRSTYSN